MFLGRFQLGQWIRVPLAARTLPGVPTQPTAVPLVTIYTAAGVKVATGRMPPMDRVAAVGLFTFSLQLTTAFAEGHYVAHVTSDVVPSSDLWHFEVIAGGDAAGAVLSMAYFPRPEASFIVAKLDSDHRLIARNPVEI